uniref:Doublecortin domain-containing protein n=1 Tax=Panagrellus redivivus TaxID=6233 RepID=A0A7E4VKH4_PANRE
MSGHDSNAIIIDVSHVGAASRGVLQHRDAQSGLPFQSGSARNTNNDGTVSLRGAVNRVEELRRLGDESTNNANLIQYGSEARSPGLGRREFASPIARYGPPRSAGMEVDDFEASVFVFPNGRRSESENEDMLDLSTVPRSPTPSDVEMEDLSASFSWMFSEPMELDAANPSDVVSNSAPSGNNTMPSHVVDPEPMDYSDYDEFDVTAASKAFDSFLKNSVESDVSHSMIAMSEEKPLSPPSTLDKSINGVTGLVLPSVVGTKSVAVVSPIPVVSQPQEFFITAEPVPKNEPIPKRVLTHNKEELPKKSTKFGDEDDTATEVSSGTDSEQESELDEAANNVNRSVLPPMAGTDSVAIASPKKVVSHPEIFFTAEPQPKADEIPKRGPTHNKDEPPKKSSKFVEEGQVSNSKEIDKLKTVQDEVIDNVANPTLTKAEVTPKREGEHDKNDEPPKKIRKMLNSDFLFDYERAEVNETDASHASDSLQADSDAEESDDVASEVSGNVADSLNDEPMNDPIPESSDSEAANDEEESEQSNGPISGDETDAPLASDSLLKDSSVEDSSDAVPHVSEVVPDLLNDEASIPEEENHADVPNEVLDETASEDDQQSNGSISGNGYEASLEAESSSSDESTGSTTISSICRRAYEGYYNTDAIELAETHRRYELEEQNLSDNEVQVEEPVKKPVPKLILTEDNASSDDGEESGAESDREASPVPPFRPPSPALSITSSNGNADDSGETVDDFDLNAWFQELLDANFNEQEIHAIPPLDVEIDDEPTEDDNDDAKSETPVNSEPDYPDIPPMDDISEPVDTDEASDAEVSDVASESAENEPAEDDEPMEVDNVPAPTVPKIRRGVDPWKVVEPVESFRQVQLPAPHDVVVRQMNCYQFAPLTPASLVKEVIGKSFIAGLYDGKLVMQGSFEGVPLSSALLSEAAVRPQMVYNDPTDRLKDVVTGDDHTVMLGESGRLYMLGRANEGQLGRDPSRHRYMTPSPLNMRVRKFIHDENGKPQMTPEVFFDRIKADGNLTVAWTKAGEAYQCGTSRDGRFCSSVLRRWSTKDGQHSGSREYCGVCSETSLDLTDSGLWAVFDCGYMNRVSTLIAMGHVDARVTRPMPDASPMSNARPTPSDARRHPMPDASPMPNARPTPARCPIPRTSVRYIATHSVVAV